MTITITAFEASPDCGRGLARDMPVQWALEEAGTRLGGLSRRLGGAQWLDGAFGAGDLLVVNVLRRLQSSGLLDGYPNLAGYLARPAFQLAFAAQLEVFERNAAAG